MLRFCYYAPSTSGRPAREVAREAIAAKAAVDRHTFQSTSVIIACAGKRATKVCAAVFTALMPAALNQSFQSLIATTFLPFYARVAIHTPL